MQGIYTYIPETNYVPREYNVATILLLLFMVLISLVSVLNLLYFYFSTFRSMCAVNNMALLLLLLSSSSSRLCRVFILIFLRQTIPREYSVAAILTLVLSEVCGR